MSSCTHAYLFSLQVLMKIVWNMPCVIHINIDSQNITSWGFFWWLFQLTLLPKKNCCFQLTSGKDPTIVPLFSIGIKPLTSQEQSFMLVENNMIINFFVYPRFWHLVKVGFTLRCNSKCHVHKTTMIQDFSICIKVKINYD
jgi:hypothetical protein